MREKNLECVKVLSAVTEKGFENNNGKTPMDIAKGLHKKFREPILEMLHVLGPQEDLPSTLFFFLKINFLQSWIHLK